MYNIRDADLISASLIFFVVNGKTKKKVGTVLKKK